MCIEAMHENIQVPPGENKQQPVRVKVHDGQFHNKSLALIKFRMPAATSWFSMPFNSRSAIVRHTSKDTKNIAISMLRIVC